MVRVKACLLLLIGTACVREQRMGVYLPVDYHSPPYSTAAWPTAVRAVEVAQPGAFGVLGLASISDTLLAYPAPDSRLRPLALLRIYNGTLESSAFPRASELDMPGGVVAVDALARVGRASHSDAWVWIRVGRDSTGTVVRGWLRLVPGMYVLRGR